MYDKESDKKSPPAITDSYTPFNIQSQRHSDSVKSSIEHGNAAGSTGRSMVPSMGANSATLEIETLTGLDNPDHIIRELQRREFEKLERWKQLLVEDEQLAKRMQEMHDAQISDHKEADVGTPRKDDSSQAVTPTFKQTVAKHKASREKALLQLQEYRKLQMDRFQGSHSQSSHTVSNVPDRHTGSRSHTVSNVPDRHTGSRSHTVSNVPDRHTGMNTQQHNVLIVDEPMDFFSNQRQYDMTNTQRPIDVINTQSNLSQHLLNHGNANTTVTNPSSHGNTTLTAGNSLTQTNIAGPSGQGVIVNDNGNNQATNPDTGMKNSNIKCGNCGEKGHYRTYVKCPRYHSAEESARREAKFEKQRQQKEEKKKQEVDTIHMLTEHRRVLEDMTTQIQREMNTIQHRLQQRASELETQVNVRVKKIEGAKKKK